MKRLARITIRPLIALITLIYRIKFIDEEKLIKQGPAILISNHRHSFDILFIMSRFKGDEIIFVGKSTVKRNPFLMYAAWAFNIILVDRDGSDATPLKNMIKTIKDGKILGIFPEGTRKGLHKGQFKSGTAYVALRTKADIIPVAINGPLKPFSKGNYVKVGDKFNLYSMMEEGKTTKDKEEVERLSELLKQKMLENVEDGFYDDLK